MNPNKRNEELLRMFGNRLRELRELKGMSQMELSALIETDQTYISRVENGQRDISISAMFEFSKALEIPLHDLVNLY